MWLLWQGVPLFNYLLCKEARFSKCFQFPLPNFIWHFSLILVLKANGCSVLLVTSSSHSWFHRPSEFLTSLVLLSCMPKLLHTFLAIKGQLVKNHSLHPFHSCLFLKPFCPSLVSLFQCIILVLQGSSRTQVKPAALLSHPPPDSPRSIPQCLGQSFPKLQKCQLLKGPGWAQASWKEKISSYLMGLHLQHQS